MSRFRAYRAAVRRVSGGAVDIHRHASGYYYFAIASDYPGALEVPSLWCHHLASSYTVEEVAAHVAKAIGAEVHS